MLDVNKRGSYEPTEYGVHNRDMGLGTSES